MELLPKLAGEDPSKLYRLVSGNRKLGSRDLEFFVCGQVGKHRTRWRAKGKPEQKAAHEELQRGDVIQGDWEEANVTRSADRGHRDLATFRSILK